MAYPADEPTAAPVSEGASRELARVNRALRTLSAGNRTLLRASDELELLRDMCRVIVETGGYRMAGVGYAEHDDEKSIHWMAHVGTDAKFLTESRLTWSDTERGHTATATAIRTGEPCVGRHILTDPVYDGPAYVRLREEAIKTGFTSASAFPLLVEGETLGALVMSAAEPDAFDDKEVELLSELVNDLAYGIANLRIRVKHREAQAAIARLAYYDPVTELPNRTLLRERLEEALQAARQQHHALALLHLEVGHFREINKVLGYRAGDELLQELGRRIARSVMENETLARVGEAEFALLLPWAGADHAIQVAQQLITTLYEPVEVAGLTVDARVTIGIALYPGHATEPDGLLRRANAAVHEAKPAGVGYAVYSGVQEQEGICRLTLMSDLRRAIKNNELHLYCQPKVDIASGRICGAEALVRWQHPQHGLISTGEFIKLAEQAGLITPLTNWVMESAFSQSFAWHDAGLDSALSINLSAHDLRDPKLIDRIRGMFSTWGVRPELIQFELTESALMEDPASALETLARLKRLDVELFIDDFGTGYSSLSYLQKLPVDSLKIDQSFVVPMMGSEDSAVIVRSTIELAHNLGLKVVAEGVESQGIWDRLAALGCDVAQGYLVSRPMPTDQFLNWNENWSKIPG